MCCGSAFCESLGGGLKVCTSLPDPTPAPLSAPITAPPSTLSPVAAPTTGVGYSGTETSCNVQGPDPSDPAVTLKLKFYVMGDAPYDEEVGSPFEGDEYNCLKNTIFPSLPGNADAIFHIGDIMKGGVDVTSCNDEVFTSRLNLFNQLENNNLDFFIIPGDNEWNE